MINGSIHEEDIIIINMEVLNNRALKFMKQKMIELNNNNINSWKHQYPVFNNEKDK